MKKIYLFLMLGLTLLSLPVTSHAQEKYALLIHYIQGEKMQRALWNDTYLMWEMLRNRGFSNDNIYVLYNDGYDYTPSWYSQRYKPNENVTITDFIPLSGEIERAIDLMDDMTEDDFLFVSIIADGFYSPNGSSGLYLYNSAILNNELAPLIDSLPAHKKVFLLQNTMAEDFVDNFESNNSIFLLQNQDAKYVLADDTICRENEIINDSIYWHSEFDYHLLSAFTGFSPDSLPYYCDSSELFVGADTNQDNIISVQEGYDWAYTHNSTLPLFHIIDSSAIDTFTSIEYPTLLHRNLYQNETHRGLIGISKNIHIPNGKTLTLKANSKIHFLNSSILYVDSGATLIVEDSVTIFGGAGNQLIVNGNIQVGTNVSFVSNTENAIFDGLNLCNGSAINTLLNVTFNRTILRNYNTNISLRNCTFNNCDKFYSTRGNVTINGSSFISTVADCSNSAGNNNYSIYVNNCDFNNHDCSSGIFISNFSFFTVSNNTIQNADSLAGTAGIYILNSGYGFSATNSQSTISNNNIDSCLSGIIAFNTTGKICDNTIQDNTLYGVKLTGTCNIQLYGNTSMHQVIKDNGSYEIYASEFAFPSSIIYNDIIDEDNGGNPTDPLLYYDRAESNSYIKKVVRYNCWGENFSAASDLYGYNVSFSWNPTCCIVLPTVALDAEEELYTAAAAAVESGNYLQAQTSYQTLIETYPESEYAQAAMKDLYQIEAVSTSDYASLQDYYLTNDSITADTTLTKLADIMANNCDIKLQNYDEAIEWYEDRIINPPSFQDSIFSVIDLENLYLLMEEKGAKTRGTLTQFVPKSLQQHGEHRDYLLSLLPTETLEQKFISPASEKIGTLLQNSPNPFSKSTVIQYSIEKEAQVSIVITDINGKKIQELPQGTKIRGMYELNFVNANFATGIYFYSLIIDGVVCDTQKMVIVK